MGFVPVALAASLVAVVLGQASPTTWGDTVRDIGFAGAALVLVWAFYTGRVHSDREFREVLAERDQRIREAEARAERWRAIALEGAIPLAREAVDAARR